jgi:diguanylate cyclase (GGDEF)-like protein/PAS domain S-box-containing protein
MDQATVSANKACWRAADQPLLVGASMNVSSKHQAPQAAFSFKLPWLVLICGLVLSLTHYQWATGRQREIQQNIFDKRVDEVRARLKRRLDGNIQVLRGVRGLFSADENVSRQEFNTYYEAMVLNRLYPGIQGIGFSEWIAAPALPAFEQRVRSEGFQNFAVKPAGNRPHYSSILFLEPFDWRNQRAFGFDMYSEPTRQNAMREAVESNQPTISGKVTLVQETQEDVQAGFLIYIPVYKKNRPVATVEERWEALAGWAYSPLRAKNLMDSFLAGQFPGVEDHIDFKVFAGTAEDWGQLLYQSKNSGLMEVGLRPVAKTLELYGNKWLIVASPRWGHWHDQDLADSYNYILLGSMVFSVLTAMFLLLLNRRNQTVSASLKETTAAKQKLEENEASLRLAGVVMEASPTGIFVANHQQQLVAVNPSFTAITGFTEAQVVGQNVDFLIGQPKGEASRIWGDLRQLGLWQGELSFRRPDGSPYPCEVSIKRVKHRNDQLTQYVGMFTDISGRRKDEERVRFLAHHDYLTGLANRALFIDRAEQALLAATRYELKPVLMFIDLDRFKPINDEHGHEAGDIVLKEVAKRLEAAVRESDLVCRLGGDEFVILLSDHQDADGIETLAQQVVRAIEKPYRVGALTLTLSASVGVSRYPVSGETVDALIASADAAMYLAKADQNTHIRLASEQG